MARPTENLLREFEATVTEIADYQNAHSFPKAAAQAQTKVTGLIHQIIDTSVELTKDERKNVISAVSENSLAFSHALQATNTRFTLQRHRIELPPVTTLD